MNANDYLIFGSAWTLLIATMLSVVPHSRMESLPRWLVGRSLLTIERYATLATCGIFGTPFLFIAVITNETAGWVAASAYYAALICTLVTTEWRLHRQRLP